MAARAEFIVRNDAVRDNAIAELRALDLDKPWRVTIERYRKRRSRSQNSLMWAWHTRVAEAVADHTGCEPDDIHQFFKAKFCPRRAIEVAGEWAETQSTTLLNTAEMTEFLNRIYAWCVTELGLILPTPGAWEECGGDMALLRERQDA